MVLLCALSALQSAISYCFFPFSGFLSALPSVPQQDPGVLENIEKTVGKLSHWNFVNRVRQVSLDHTPRLRSFLELLLSILPRSALTNEFNYKENTKSEAYNGKWTAVARFSFTKSTWSWQISRRSTSNPRRRSPSACSLFRNSVTTFWTLFTNSSILVLS